MREEHGSAPVEFVLVMTVLIPLFVGIFQVGLFLHARNTMTACAHDGARVGASFDRDETDAQIATQQCITDALGSQWAPKVHARLIDGAAGPTIEVEFDAHMPILGPWPERLASFDLHVQGHAIKEPEL